jgi:hypothetical protein
MVDVWMSGDSPRECGWQARDQFPVPIGCSWSRVGVEGGREAYIDVAEPAPTLVADYTVGKAGVNLTL